MAIKVGPLFAVGGGVILLWSGFTNRKWSTVLKDVIKGEDPRKALQNANTITGTSASALGGSGGYSASIFPGNTPIGQISGTSNQGIAKQLLSHYGWSLSEMIPLIALWTRESGWNSNARNSTSGAYGIAQALGHGQAGTAAPNGTNEYGAEYGLTQREAQLANAGSAEWQIVWGLGYIKAEYGSPSGAWAHEESAGWY